MKVRERLCCSKLLPINGSVFFAWSMSADLSIRGDYFLFQKLKRLESLYETYFLLDMFVQKTVELCLSDSFVIKTSLTTSWLVL